MKIQHFLLLLIVTIQSFGQSTVKGKIFDAKTNEPMPFASVYISNSTKGTQSDENGNYQINNVPLGNVQLVVSFVGYDVYQQIIKVEVGKTLEVNIRLVPMTNALSDVEIKSKKDKDWERKLKDFRRMFLGDSPNALDCKILNEWVLEFDTYSNGTFKATAQRPLEIENRGLGYKLYYDLKDFSRSRDNVVVFLGTTRFEELSPKDAKEFNKWQRNRQDTYLRSPEKFMKSLFNGTLTKDGYLVYQMENQGEWFLGATDFQKAQNIINDANAVGKIMTLISEKEKMLRFDLPLEITMTQFNANNVARLRMRKPAVEILSDGWINDPVGLEMGNVWSKQRIGDMLPREYGISIEIVQKSTNPVNKEKDFSRIYIQTSKAGYVVGEKIWFSAYLTDTDKRLARKVMPMYVQFHSPTGDVVHEQIIYTSNGRGYGYMPIADSLYSGVYRLRAYTREMLNLPQTVFEKEIVIQHPFNEFLTTRKTKTWEGEPNEKLDITIETDKNEYKPNEKVTLKLKTKNAFNENTSGTFSVVVNDVNRQVADNEDFTISSYSSKGLKNPQVIGNQFAYEPNISVSGVVRNERSKQPMSNAKLIFVFANAETTKTRVVEADTKGKFRINDLDFEGENVLSYQVNNKKDKPDMEGELVLDKFPIPLQLAPILLEKTAISPEKQKEWSWTAQHPDGEKKADSTKVVQDVPEEKTVSKRDQNEVGVIKIYNEPDYTVSFDKQMNFPNVYEMLQGQLPGVRVDNLNGSYKVFIRGINTWNNTDPLFLVDGFEITDLRSVNPNDVIKIDLLSGAKGAIFGSRGANGVIAFYTRRFGEKKAGLQVAKSAFVRGYQKEKRFYSPDYQQITIKKEADKRTTIYWNPEVIIDSNGETTLTFYTADLPTTYKVIVEGINLSGQVGRGEAKVVVK
jgi:hypothetical protein